MTNGIKLVYDVYDKLPFKKNIIFALQQFLAVIAATILVPVLVNSATSTEYLNQASALVGAGMGTIVYLLFTRFKSPVFLGSSFAFIPALIGAVSFGYFGIIMGAIMAGLVYVLLAAIIWKCGTDWVDKYMPPIIIGPTVALIGLSLAGSAIGNLGGNTSYVTIFIGIATFMVVALASNRGPKSIRLYPFIIGIMFGYILAALLTIVGNACNIEELIIMDYSAFDDIGNFDKWIPDLTFLGAIDQGTSLMSSAASWVTVAVLFIPIAFVVFAEHIADHKNLSSIINHDLIKEPGLKNTLLGDGVGSMVGAFFGGCPNTTYGESIGCVALSRNASISTILLTAIICIVVAFIYPFVAFLTTIPTCVVGGISIALYGYIAVSGLRMFKEVDLNDSKNLYVVAAIFITGIGGLSLQFDFDGQAIVIGTIACALIIGIITNLLLSWKAKEDDDF